jgi:hypothetical protein
MTASPPAARPARPPGRSVELVLAHAHLRLGSLSLARVELETMAGLGLLDTAGIVDLAEVRWRTGDLMGAGEAAGAALADDDTLPVALVIAAEAAAALGRPTEARRLAERAMTRTRGAIDGIFAGMPRSTVWPADSAEPPPTAPTLFDRDPEPLTPVVGTHPGHDRPTERQPAATTAAPLTLGLWEADEGSEPAAAVQADPADELEAGRAALVAGHIDEAALRFGLALRLAPALAPAVLEATDGVRGPELILVRGDAYRLAGHETEAQQAYAIAAQGGLLERRKTPRNPPNTLVEEPTRPPRATETAASPAASTETPGTAVAASDGAPTAVEIAAPAGGAAPAPTEEPVEPAVGSDAPEPDPGPGIADVAPADATAPAPAADDAPPAPDPVQPTAEPPADDSAAPISDGAAGPASASAPTTNGSSGAKAAKPATKAAAAKPAPAEAPIEEAVTPDGTPD